MSVGTRNLFFISVLLATGLLWAAPPKTLWQDKPDGPIETKPSPTASSLPPTRERPGAYKNDASIEDLELHREHQKAAVEDANQLLKLIQMGGNSSLPPSGTIRVQQHSSDSSGCNPLGAALGAYLCKVTDVRLWNEKAAWTWGMKRLHFVVLNEMVFFFLFTLFRRWFYSHRHRGIAASLTFESFVNSLQWSLLVVGIPLYAMTGKFFIW